MRYKVIMVLLALFLVVGAQCDLKGLGKGDKSKSMVDDYSGSKGLVLSFAEGMPPKEVWRDVDFNVQVDIHNQGGDDVKEGRVCVGTFPEGSFDGGDGSCEELGEILGRRSFPGGQIRDYGRDKWRFRLTKAFDVDQGYPFLAKACYKYTTSLAPLVCVRDPYMDEREAVCSAGEIEVGDGQGGPVAVTYLKEDIVPKGESNELLLTIKIKNVGGGEVIKYNLGLDDCSFEKNQKDIVKIEVLGEESGFGGDIECNSKSDGEVYLRGGEGVAFCRGIEVRKGSSYTLPLNIKLIYSYLSHLKGQFTIKKEIVGG